MSDIQTYGIHDQFSMKPENKESLSVVQTNGITLVVDCPAHTVRSLHNDTELVAKSTQTKVDYLILTHLDNDHVGGIEQLLWWKVFAEKTKLNLITHSAIYEGLWKRIEMIFGQDRTTQVPKQMQMSDFVHFIPLEYGKEIHIPQIGKIQAFDRSAVHSTGMDVLAFRVQDEAGKSLGNFSADTGFDSELIDFLAEKKGPIIHEVGAYTEGSFSHTHIKELIHKVASDVQSRIFINHIPELIEPSIQLEISQTGSPIRFAHTVIS